MLDTRRVSTLCSKRLQNKRCKDIVRHRWYHQKPTGPFLSGPAPLAVSTSISPTRTLFLTNSPVRVPEVESASSDSPVQWCGKVVPRLRSRRGRGPEVVVNDFLICWEAAREEYLPPLEAPRCFLQAHSPEDEGTQIQHAVARSAAARGRRRTCKHLSGARTIWAAR